MCRSASVESYLLTYNYNRYMVPRFRLPAPLRGSTPRRLLISVFVFARWCRSAQNDTDSSHAVGYNLKVVKVILSIEII